MGKSMTRIPPQFEVKDTPAQFNTDIHLPINVILIDFKATDVLFRLIYGYEHS